MRDRFKIRLHGLATLDGALENLDGFVVVFGGCATHIHQHLQMVSWESAGPAGRGGSVRRGACAITTRPGARWQPDTPAQGTTASGAGTGMIVLANFFAPWFTTRCGHSIGAHVGQISIRPEWC